MDDNLFRITREQRVSLVRLLNSEASREYFTDEEANDLTKVLDPGGFLMEIEEVADQLEENEWYGPAGDLRDEVSPQTIINRVEEMTDDDAERARAIPLLQTLIPSIERSGEN